MTDIQDNGR